MNLSIKMFLYIPQHSTLELKFFLCCSIFLQACSGSSPAEQNITPEMLGNLSAEVEVSFPLDDSQALEQNENSFDVDVDVDEEMIIDDDVMFTNTSAQEPIQFVGINSSEEFTSIQESGGVVAYRVLDLIPRFAGDFVVNRFGQIASFGADLGNSDFLDVGTGTLDSGITDWVTVGNGLPGIDPATRIASLGSLSLAPNGTTAFVAQLTGSRPGTALAVVNEQAVKTILRNGETIEFVNAGEGQVSRFGAPRKSRNEVFFMVELEDENSFLARHDGEQFTAIASSMPLAFTRIAMGDTTCNFSVSSSVGLNFHVSERDAVVFPVRFDEQCPYNSGFVRYIQDNYELIISDEKAISGAEPATFGSSGIVEIAPDGTVAITNNIDFNEDPGGSRRGFAPSWWELSMQNAPQFLLAEGESVETPSRSYVLGSTDVEKFDWAANGQYAVYAEFDNEEAFFVGQSNLELPYESFTQLGASTLQFRFSTTSVVPAPYDEQSFFSQLRSFHILDNGQLLFFASVTDSPISGSTDTSLWLSSAVEQAALLMRSGDDIPLSTGGTFRFVGELFSKMMTLEDGSILIGPKGVPVMFRVFTE